MEEGKREGEAFVGKKYLSTAALSFMLSPPTFFSRGFFLLFFFSFCSLPIPTFLHRALSH